MCCRYIDNTPSAAKPTHVWLQPPCICSVTPCSVMPLSKQSQIADINRWQPRQWLALVLEASCACCILFIYRYSGFFYEGDVSGGQQRPWFLSFTFAVACCVIVSGCLAERTRLLVYPVYTVVVTAVVHPILVHWIWVDNSWVNSISQCRVLDFAGGLAVHALGE